MITPYDLCLVGLLVVKLAFIAAFVANRANPSDFTAKAVEVMSTTFDVLMACLMIYLFRPRSPNPTIVDQETKIFLFTFAILSIVHHYRYLV